MATGVNGHARACAPQHAGPGNRSGGEFVTVLGLDWGAGSALAQKGRQRTAAYLLPGLGGKDWHGLGPVE